MGLTDQDLDTLAPSGYQGPVGSTAETDDGKTTGYAWAIFYIIILTLVIFFILYAFNSPGKSHGKGKKGNRSKIDQTAYGWNLLIALIAAVVIVFAVSYYRRGRK